jgi:FkbM family methyltransferase
VNVRPAPDDPPEIVGYLWDGFSGQAGWDVGGNCGQSVPKMRGRFARVISFEPCRESFDYACREFPESEIYQVALSDLDGEVELAEVDGLHADTGMLVSPGAHGMEWDEGRLASPEVRVRKVPCRTADSLALELGAPDFVKVDTEGHEFRILNGAHGLLDAGKTSWLVEFHSPALHGQCTDLLAGYGYLVETVRHPHYAPGSADWLMHGWLRALPPESL